MGTHLRRLSSSGSTLIRDAKVYRDVLLAAVHKTAAIFVHVTGRRRPSQKRTGMVAANVLNL